MLDCHNSSLSGEPSGVHRIIDATTGDRIRYTCRISDDHHIICNSTGEWFTDRDAADDEFDRLSFGELLGYETVEVILCAVTVTAL